VNSARLRNEDRPAFAQPTARQAILQRAEAAQRHCMSSSHPLCNLRVSRQEADTKLAERINMGEALLGSAKQLREEVFSGVGYERVPDIKHTERHNSLWSECSRWNDFNKALLNRLFDSQEIAVEYGTPKEPKPTYGVLLAEIEEFENVLKDDLQELRSIKERLPLLEEVLPRDLIQTAKSNTMDPKNFFSELKRRNVYKVAVAYAVVGWLLVQVASILFPTFDAPPWVMKVFVLCIVLGFVPALIFPGRLRGSSAMKMFRLANRSRDAPGERLLP
jgi:hypothetical protein